MSDGAECWLVGQADDGSLHIVPGRRVGDPVDGRQTVDIRPGCRSSMLVTVPVVRVCQTEEEAETRRTNLLWEAVAAGG